MAVEKEEGIMEVSASCTAPVHNTYRAAVRPRRDPLRCDCPRALELREQELERNRAGRRRRAAERIAAGGAPPRVTSHVLPGGGPWRILPDCPALLHNTMRAATQGAAEHRCVCPRGLVMKGRYVQQKNASRARRNQEKPRGPQASTIMYLNNVRRPANTPSLTGPCKTPEGLELADRVLSGRSGSVELHRLMCQLCPTLQRCRTWVLEEEVPAGSWGGMYGGLTVTDRRRMARKVVTA